MALLEIDKLTMRFGGLTAVQELDLRIEEGQIASLIGPNGAGKTTVFNAVSGVYEATQGTIKIDGRSAGVPLTALRVAAWLAMGMATGVLALLIGVDFDQLWTVAITRNMRDPDGFSYTKAFQDGWDYICGHPAIERVRQDRWRVHTFDGRTTLARTKTIEEAQQEQTRFEQLIAQHDSEEMLARQADQWVVHSTKDNSVLFTYPTREAAIIHLAEAATWAQAQRAHQRFAWISMLTGLVLGTLTGFIFWKRSQYTPEVVGLSGVARTFQNIRLFPNMTVVENVLIGMDRHFASSVAAMILNVFGLNREEEARLNRAMDVLNFLGIANLANELAKNLPYGSQRRLEIARALATQPRLLLLDEPAAGMNPTEARTLIAHIGRIRNRGVTILLIEHHMNIVMAISDRIAVLDHGVKIAEGTPAEIRENAAVIEAYLGKEGE